MSGIHVQLYYQIQIKFFKGRGIPALADNSTAIEPTNSDANGCSLIRVSNIFFLTYHKFGIGIINHRYNTKAQRTAPQDQNSERTCYDLGCYHKHKNLEVHQNLKFIKYLNSSD